jgi:hypothetical protein
MTKLLRVDEGPHPPPRDVVAAPLFAEIYLYELIGY